MTRTSLCQDKRARVGFAAGDGDHAPTLLLRAAERLAGCDTGLARDLYLEAFGAALSNGHTGNDQAAVVAEAARHAPPALTPVRPVDLFLDGLITRFTEGYAASVPGLRRALEGLSQGDDAVGDGRLLRLALRIATDLWDDVGWRRIVDIQAERSRTSSSGFKALLSLDASPVPPVALSAFTFTRAAAETVAAGAMARDYLPSPDQGLVEVAAVAHDPDGESLAELCLQRRMENEGREIFMVEYASAVLCNGLGRYEAALTAATRACAHEDLGLHGWALSERVEAAVRALQCHDATEATARLSERTRASGTEWALGIEARARALVSQGVTAEAFYRESVERLRRTNSDVHLARSRLVYGEWLRRENRRVDARDQLRQAHTTFSTAGATAFAQRAHRELLATGEKVRKRSVAGYLELTAQERQVARLAGERLTNPEIASQLFISPRTVEWHLRKVFTKLGVRSRRELCSSLVDLTGVSGQAVGLRHVQGAGT